MLILASSSPYRKLLLERLGISFQILSPDIDESPLPGEQPGSLVERLANEKALAIAQTQPAALVIGSDQVAVFEGQIIGKPGKPEIAEQQLEQFSGRQVLFHTAISVRRIADGFLFKNTVDTRVTFRPLEQDEIRRYVAAENPVDCAGGFKAEASGICLFRSLESTDPTALIGLPLITTSEALRQAGLQLP